MNVLIRRKLELPSGEFSVVYWISNGDENREVGCQLPAGTNPETYGEDHAAKLFAEGKVVNAKVSSQAAFEALRQRRNEAALLKSIFVARRALLQSQNQPASKHVPIMLQAIESVYAEAPALRTEVAAFLEAYAAALPADRGKLNAYSLFTLLALATSLDS